MKDDDAQARALTPIPLPAVGNEVARLIPIDCRNAPELFNDYLDGKLAPGQEILLRQHVDRCEPCREALAHRQLCELHHETTSHKGISAITHFFVDTDPRQRWRQLRQLVRFETDAGTPWWMVSVIFHLLIIALAGLVSMAISVPVHDDSIIMSTDLQPAAPNIDAEEVRHAPIDALMPNHEVHANDLAKPIPLDIVNKIEAVDHFQSVNPEVADVQSVLSDDDRDVFDPHAHNLDKPEPEGGGGANGTAAFGIEQTIGVGGSTGKGSGGGFGGGDGSGIGTGTGSGSGFSKGGFGYRAGEGRKRLLKRNGGSPATEGAVEQALHWLAYHQEPDGHWNVGKYEGAAGCDAGITGIALLAFLGAGNSEKAGEYKDNVRRALGWIISKQGPDGSIGKGFKEMVRIGHPGHAYHHAICGLALAEAAAMSQNPITMDAAQRAVYYSTEIHQGGNGSQKWGWRYEPKKDEDASVTGWFVMQLKSAKIAGLRVPPASLEGALHFYDSIEKKSEFNGYKGGRFPYQRTDSPQLNPTAIGMLCNLFLGRQPGDLMGGAEYLSQNLPQWDAGLGEGVKGFKFPIYYTYYGTLTMFQMGGDYWKKWNDAMQATLLPRQRKDGDATGSWDLIGGADDEMGGRVYMTAMGALCLEVFYRYLLQHPK